MLMGCRVPYRNRYMPSDVERQVINQRRAMFKAQAKTWLTLQQVLEFIRHPQWRGPGKRKRGRVLG